jgi:hypothetical protein
MVDMFLAGDSTPDKLINLTDEYSKKLDFISKVVKLNADFFADPGDDWEQKVGKDLRDMKTAYVFRFNNSVMNEVTSWEENLEILWELLTRRQYVLLIDCSSTGIELAQAYISIYSNGEVVTKDLLQLRKELAKKHFIRYNRSDLKNVTDLPAHRRFVKINCPGWNCNGQGKLEWACSTCYVPMEYGTLGNFLYCDCGRIPLSAVEFNCQLPQHGPAFEKYQPNQLARLLNHLPPPREVNILILGETGVGKSTFVNAFINYLSFDTFDEARNSSRLNWVIPCSFSIQVSEHGKIVSKFIKVGLDDNGIDNLKG